MVNRIDDAVERYEDTEARRRQARAQWVDEGRPLTLKHNNGAIGVHPLLKVLVEAEAHSAKLAKAVRVAGLVGGKGGRPRGTTTAPDRLKVVGQ